MAKLKATTYMIDISRGNMIRDVSLAIPYYSLLLARVKAEITPNDTINTLRQILLHKFLTKG